MAFHRKRFQATGADANPSLQVATTGLPHHTRFVAIGAHGFKHTGLGLIKIQETISRITIPSVEQDIDVTTPPLRARSTVPLLRVRNHPRSTPVLRSWSACEPVNQADKMEIIRHARQLPLDRMQGEKESAVRHGSENEVEGCSYAIDF